LLQGFNKGEIMITDKVIHFQGSLAVEGDLSKLDMEKLKTYLTKVISIDIDIEEHGQLSDDLDVTGVGIDWESLN